MHNASAHQDSGIFPVTERVGFVDIFVREVDSARKRGFAVDDCDFAVGAVILSDVQNGSEGIETHTLDAALFEDIRVISGHFQHGTDIVVDEADIDAVFCFIFQDLEHAVEKFSWFDDEIFQEDVFFGLFKLCQQLGGICLSGGEVLIIRAVGKRHAGMNGDIFGALCGKVVVSDAFTVRIVLFGICVKAFGAAETGGKDQSSAAGEFMPPQHDIEQDPDGGQKQDGEDPGDLIFCVHVEVDDINGGDGVYDGEDSRIDGVTSVRERHGKKYDRAGDQRKLDQ